jgi:hypothetical protein
MALVVSKSLVATKRDGSLVGLYPITSSTNLRATRRDGTFASFKFTAGKAVRVTMRDGSFIDLALDATGRHVHDPALHCMVCGMSMLGCRTCGWLACGHGAVPACTGT